MVPKCAIASPEVELWWAEAALRFQRSVEQFPIVVGIDANATLEAARRPPPPEARVGRKPANVAGHAAFEAALAAAVCCATRQQGASKPWGC